MTTVTTLLTLEVARAVNAAAAENACDSVEVIVDRVEICYRNETFAAMSDELRENDPLGVSHRDIVPLDTDDVKLYAIVWAKEPAEADFKPYCGDAGFDNNGMFFQVGELKGSPGGRNRPPVSWFERMLDEKLDPEIKRVEPWKWCRELQFDWIELAFAVSGKTIVGGKVTARNYRYKTETPLDVEEETETQKHGWVVTPTPEAGTRRFRVKATLPEGVRLDGEDEDRTGETTIASRVKRDTRQRKGYNERGFALRLSVRKADVPQARTTELTEMLRWGTAFLDVPYYNGGQWLGGRAADDVSQSSDAFRYQGHGFDCNGFICAAAELAGLDWALREDERARLREQFEDDDEFEKAARKDFQRRWRFATRRKGGRLFPGAQVASGDDLQPGDLLDFTGHSHVALVWEVFEEDGSQRIRVLDCSGGADRVSLHVLAPHGHAIEPDTVGTHCELVDFSDPQRRPWRRLR